MSKTYRTTLNFNPDKPEQLKAHRHLEELRRQRPDLSINDIMARLLLEDAERAAGMADAVGAVKELTASINKLTDAIRQTPMGTVTPIMAVAAETKAETAGKVFDLFGY